MENLQDKAGDKIKSNAGDSAMGAVTGALVQRLVICLALFIVVSIITKFVWDCSLTLFLIFELVLLSIIGGGLYYSISQSNASKVSKLVGKVE